MTHFPCPPPSLHETAEPYPDHKAALAALPPDRLADWARPSNAPGLLRLLSHLAAIAVAGALALSASGPAQIAAQALLGVFITFLFAPLHECIHRTAFRSRWLNDLVAEICGFVMLLPPRRFRFFHFAHHRHTQDPENDPELASPKPATWPAYLWALTGWAYWSSQIRLLLGSAFGAPLPDYVPARAAQRVRWEARAHCAGYLAVIALSIVSGSTLALTLWVVPALLGQPWLRAYLLAEHTACPLVPDMLQNTRTTFANRLIRWFAWEMPNHTAHHALPQAPFHRLPEVTEALRPSLRSTAESYPDAHRQILATFPR